MLVIISPAKKLDFTSSLPAVKTSLPVFIAEAERLIVQLKQFSVPHLAQLMHLSDKLARLNYQRYQDWSCLLYTSPSPRDLSTSRMPSSA